MNKVTADAPGQWEYFGPLSKKYTTTHHWRRVYCWPGGAVNTSTDYITLTVRIVLSLWCLHCTLDLTPEVCRDPDSIRTPYLGTEFQILPAAACR
jgi:hypothetical protein